MEIGRSRRRRVADLLIAATAHANGLPLYTRNPDDFDGLGNWSMSSGSEAKVAGPAEPDRHERLEGERFKLMEAYYANAIIWVRMISQKMLSWKMLASLHPSQRMNQALNPRVIWVVIFVLLY